MSMVRLEMSWKGEFLHDMGLLGCQPSTVRLLQQSQPV